MNPGYFPYADRRIECLVNAGIVPALVGGWGRAVGLNVVGLDGYKRHFRNLIARYGAYPVVWILGGETDSSQGPWYQLAQYVSASDPYQRVLVNHTSGGRTALEGSAEFDFDMVVPGHNSWSTANSAIAQISSFRALTPIKPVLTGEACYERHMQQNFQDLQRYLFWGCLLSGAAGHTYGAAGVWPAGVPGNHGNWGYSGGQPYDWTTWAVGMNYPGSTQLGLCKQLLVQYPWWQFEPHPEWTSAGFAAGIPTGTRIIYIPNRGIYNWSGITVNNLLSGVPYIVFFFDPATGRHFDQGIVTPSGSSWSSPSVPSPQDWVLVMQAAGATPVVLTNATAGQAYTGQLSPAGAAFAKLSGPAWLTINPDGSFTGTPGQTDAGVNTWIVAVSVGGGSPTYIQLQITVVGAPGILFAENFNSYSGTQNNTQYQTGLPVAYGGNITGWSKSGLNAVHAVNLGGGNWAIMFYQDNAITLSSGIAANNSGAVYKVEFDYGTAVYAQSSQATATNDALIVDILRTNGTVLASGTNAPGAWSYTNNVNLSAGLQGTLQYTGDGSGNVQLRVKCLNPTADRFNGAIDNLVVRQLVPAITNTAAANIGYTNATLVGTLDAQQWAFTVTAYWSTNNNANAAAWLADGAAARLLLGTYTNATSQSVAGLASGLLSGTTYYYTLLATNAATNLWASPNASFTTATTSPFGQWQTQYFGSTTNPLAAPDADPCGKGMSNTNQFLADLDPTNPASRLAITSISPSNASSFITWIGGGTGAVQVLQTRGSLTDSNSWSAIFQYTPAMPTIPSSTNYLDPGALTNNNRFYRLRAYRP